VKDRWHPWTRNELLDAIRAVAIDGYAHSKANEAVGKASLRLFESWSTACEAAGVQPAYTSSLYRKRGAPAGLAHPRWTGDSASYTAVHFRLVATRGRPQRCDECGRSDPGRYSWALKKDAWSELKDDLHRGPYSTRLTDYDRLCNGCHNKRDQPLGSRRRRGPVYVAEQKRAERLLRSAIKHGLLVRPTSCKECHRSSEIVAHHRDYSKPLEVEWLCRKCHGKADSELRRQQGWVQEDSRPPVEFNRECPVDGIRFHATGSHVYCSDACMVTARKARVQIRLQARRITLIA